MLFGMGESSETNDAQRVGRSRRAKFTRSWYIDRDVWERGRNAVAHTRLIEGEAGSYGELVERALRREVERLEASFNGGKPFPSSTLPSGPGWRPR
jgi:Centromere-binding protein ParB C-terminal